MNKTFCTYPWTSLTYLPDNKTKICGANRDHNHDPDNDRKNTQVLKTARLKMLKGETVPGCEFCYVRENNEYWNTKRKESLKIWGKWQDEFINATDGNGNTTFQPFYIDYRESDVNKLSTIIKSLPRVRVLKLYKIDYTLDWSTAFKKLKNKMGHFYCCGDSNKFRFDKEFLDVESRSRRVSIIHNLQNTDPTFTVNKVQQLQELFTGEEDEVQLYVQVKEKITNNFLNAFEKFDHAFPNIKLRIYADDINKVRGDPIEYYNGEIAVANKMKELVNSSNNEDLQALYKQLS